MSTSLCVTFDFSEVICSEEIVIGEMLLCAGDETLTECEIPIDRRIKKLS